MLKTKAPRARSPRGTILREIKAARRQKEKEVEMPPREKNTYQNNKKRIMAAASNELEEERKLFSTPYCVCANTQCKNGENGTRKQILGRPYGGIGDKDGVCSTGCQRAMDKLKEDNRQRQEDAYFARLKERGIELEN